MKTDQNKPLKPRIKNFSRSDLIKKIIDLLNEDDTIFDYESQLFRDRKNLKEALIEAIEEKYDGIHKEEILEAFRADNGLYDIVKDIIYEREDNSFELGVDLALILTGHDTIYHTLD